MGIALSLGAWVASAEGVGARLHVGDALALPDTPFTIFGAKQ